MDQTVLVCVSMLNINRTLTLLFIIISLFLLSSCKTKNDKKYQLEGKTLSILGDSISTFYKEGSSINNYYSEGNINFYPRDNYGIKEVSDTWWGQLIDNTKMKLGVNNSWSGSRAVANDNSAGTSDNRINSLFENGTPDIIIIYLGTNDSVRGVNIDLYKEAMNEIINKIRKKGRPDIFLTTLGYNKHKSDVYSDEVRIIYNNTIKEIAVQNKCGIIPLDNYITKTSHKYYLKDSVHYNKEGATLLSKIYEKSITEYYNYEFNEIINVRHQSVYPFIIATIILITIISPSLIIIFNKKKQNLISK